MVIARPVVLALVLAANVARAAPDPCATPPIDPSTRAMSVELTIADGDFVYPILTATAGSAFPAVSKDGKTIVQLFADDEDFSGAPTSTLVFWSSAGKRLATFMLGGTRASRADGVDPRTPTAKERALAKAANARLRRTSWRPLAMHPACARAGAADDDERTRVVLDGDVDVTFDRGKQQLTAQRAGRAATVLRGRFPSPGERMEAPRGGCGDVMRLEYGFGGGDLGLAILVPGANLGGDSCFGLSSARKALAVRLR
jgi:hypothetical protein